MAIRRFKRIIKPLAQKGRPGTPLRRISVRIDDRGQRRNFHPTKGWRCLA